MHGEAVGRLIVTGDVRGSGAFGDRAKLSMRKVLYEVFDSAFAAVGVAEGDRQQGDRGDGILAVLSPWVPPARMVGPWVDTLYQRLRLLNEERLQRVRLRVSMHVGPVADDGRGLVGRAVDLTCRLCDSDAVKQTLEAASRYDLVHAVSDYLFQSTVRHGGEAIEPDHYRPVRVVVKETDETAWVRVPGLPVPPVPEHLRVGTGARGRAEPGGPNGEPQRAAPTSAISTHGKNSPVITGSTISDSHFGDEYYGHPLAERRGDRSGGME